MSITKAIGMTVVAGAASLLVGCANAPIPVASNFEYTSQLKVRSAGHWELVSRDVVSQTLGSLHAAGAEGAPLFVGLPPNPSTFDYAFRDFLITQFVQSGTPVMQAPGDTLDVTYQAQVVRHNSDRPHFIPGMFTMLAAGVGAAYGLRLEHVDTKIIAGLGLAVAADVANSINSGGPTHTEMILTTTVSRAGQYVVRKTDVYYLEDADTPLFMRKSPYRPQPLKVVSQ
ncbi:MAG: hypothetical protein KA749_11945 [Acidovorax sp.]|jgi:hypothetical protein|nr:hypothetical protein [Acidovorax sp.]